MNIRDESSQIIHICLYGVVACILTMNGSIFIYHSQKYLTEHSSTDLKSFILLKNLGLGFFFTCTIFHILYCFIYIQNYTSMQYENLDQINMFLKIFSSLLFVTAIMINSLFLIVRLFRSFENTVYAIKQSKIITLLIMAIINPTIYFICHVIYILFETQFGILYDIYAFILWLWFGIQHIYIANVFSSKLIQLTLSIHHNSLRGSPAAGSSSNGIGIGNRIGSGINSLDNSINSNDNMNDIMNIKQINSSKQSIFLSDNQKNTLDIIAKQTLLSRIESSMVAIIVILWGLEIFCNFMMEQNIFNYQPHFWTNIIKFLFTKIYYTIVSITFPFSFVFAKSKYDIYCQKCHVFCVGRYYNRVTKQAYLPLVTDDPTIN